MTPIAPTEDELHAWVDSQLDARARARVDAWLAAHPQDAARVAAWKQDAERLRTALAAPAVQPVDPRLDPAHVRRRLHARRRRRWAVAAGMLLALGLGGAGGWQAREQALLARRLPMADAVSAYRLFATEDAPPGSLGPSEAAPLRDWLRLHFGAEGRLPDLSAQGFALRSARLLSTAEGAAAMLIYEDGAGGRVGVYLRPGDHFPEPGARRDGPLLARYWSHGDTSFALVGAADDSRVSAMQRTLMRGRL
ncbi:anti-sigma factor family protein [Coralloluteibacterium stylophorae]|uniref:Anti-sigma factor n=1 Tax=Coralloluteibacterium stylophorae TaxID=1776034 RepID=A0A8J7VW61_9GAMM|nr:anti-sigma factor [Coralloluteibacterium stylophorae]MBS7458644.1 anti-sigma factor [Coralloluteibacterium stylophorae]